MAYTALATATFAIFFGTAATSRKNRGRRPLLFLRLL